MGLLEEVPVMKVARPGFVALAVLEVESGEVEVRREACLLDLTTRVAPGVAGQGLAAGKRVSNSAWCSCSERTRPRISASSSRAATSR